MCLASDGGISLGIPEVASMADRRVEDRLAVDISDQLDD